MRTIEEIKADIAYWEDMYNEYPKDCEPDRTMRISTIPGKLLKYRRELTIALTKRTPLDRLEEICNAEREGRLPANLSCVWNQQDIDGSWYSCSNCGAEWVLEADDPFENNMKFCPECGAYIKSITFREYDEVLEDIVDRVITREAAEQAKERE